MQIAKINETKYYRYYILSPDNITISSNSHSTPKKALEELDKWALRFTKQGYYSSNNGRIGLLYLKDKCRLVEEEVEYINKTNTVNCTKEEKQTFCNFVMENLEKKIKENYNESSLDLFRRKEDIRMRIFNLDNPLCQMNKRGIDYRITNGITINKQATYLLYIDKKIKYFSYSVDDLKRKV